MVQYLWFFQWIFIVSVLTLVIRSRSAHIRLMKRFSLLLILLALIMLLIKSICVVFYDALSIQNKYFHICTGRANILSRNLITWLLCVVVTSHYTPCMYRAAVNYLIDWLIAYKYSPRTKEMKNNNYKLGEMLKRQLTMVQSGKWWVNNLLKCISMVAVLSSMSNRQHVDLLVHH